ncbi:formate dehydrogenase subunit gamma [Desulfuribacillus stibiiarsenatis]|nr:cytochrome b/b6 domain-containing protein [Desulfuribacillus stibiiarsenatis]
MNNKILRHSNAVRVIHWLTAISIFLLIFSGIGQMPMYKRYMLSEVIGMGWTADYQVTLVIHYIASVILVTAVAFHLYYHFLRKEFNLIPKRGDIRESIQIIKAMFGKGEEPPSEKYLAEQRIAYLYIAFSVGLLIITGFVKVIKNFAFFSISETTMIVITLLHNIGMVLIMIGIIAHVAAFAIKANRPLVKTMFTGYVDEDYVKHRHSLWYQQMNSKQDDKDQQSISS